MGDEGGNERENLLGEDLPKKRTLGDAEEPPKKVQKRDDTQATATEHHKQRETVIQHYNKPEQGLKNRSQSPIFHLRNFNNWTKSILLKKYISLARQNQHRPRDDRDLYALDLCCGKMGDALKWRNGNVQCVVGADIALESLKDGMQRYYDRRMDRNFSLSLIHADCTVVDITPGLPNPKMLFDITSCQFALHYGFETEEHARMLFQNATKNLRKGGYFIGTIPIANVLLDRVKSDGKSWRGTDDICVVEFEDDITDLQRPVGCGVKYNFSLKDAIDNCPEYLVSVEKLTAMAAEFDLALEEIKCFKRFKDENINRNRRLWDKMNVEGLSPEEYEVIDLYQIFAFKKREGRTSNIYQVPNTRDDIVTLS